MNNNEKKLLGLSCFLGGIVVGFLISPIKKGMYFGNNCGNNLAKADDLKPFEETDLEKNGMNN